MYREGTSEAGRVNYLQTMENALKYLKTLEKRGPVDRLNSMTRLLHILGVMMTSIQSWIQWLSNSAILESFSQEELVRVEEQLRSAAIYLVTLDIDWTRRKAPSIEKAEKKKTRMEV